MHKLLFTLIVFLLTAPTLAQQRNLNVGTNPAATRVALVVGNDAYTKVPPLRNARADAQAMAGALKGAGFDVILRTDLNERGLRAAVRDFVARLSGGSEAVFYFAGHGVQLGSANYLLPIDIEAGNEAQVRDDGLPLQRVLDDLTDQKVRFSVAIIDACRDNPFPRIAGRSIGTTRGLAPTSPATGQMVLFSAGTGQSALDRLGPNDRDPNGLFTRVLLKQMQVPGVAVDQVLKRTRQEVVALAKGVGHDQVPALYDQTIGEFYFRPGSATAVAPAAAGAAQQPVPVRIQTAEEIEQQLWDAIKDSRNAKDFDDYLASYPSGRFAAIARAKTRSLTPQVAIAPATSQQPQRIDAPLRPAGAASAQGSGTVRVGILHSLSGTMASTESPLKDVALMAIEEINARGGVLGQKLDPVVVDPASNWPMFAEKARQLLVQDKVAVTFGGWTSVSRKSVLPVFESMNGLLVYPAQYEGQEASKNIFYTGMTPAQQAIPAAEYLLSKDGGGAQRFLLLGTDYVFPRTTNKILRGFLRSRGISERRDIEEMYVPFGHSDFSSVVSAIKNLSTGGKTAVISTISGDSNPPFYRELARQGVSSRSVPVLAISMGEDEWRGSDGRYLTGQLVASGYFMSLRSRENDEFKRNWAAFAAQKRLPPGSGSVTTDAMAATYTGVNLWKAAVEKAGSFDVDRVRAAMAGQVFRAPTGELVEVDPENHHLKKRTYIGEIRADGQVSVIWKSINTIGAQPWNPYLSSVN